MVFIERYISSYVKKIYIWGSLVKFTHTVFALPFALSMAIVACRTHSVTRSQILYIFLALVSARTAAMIFNRIVDRGIDAMNPRAVQREIPSGKVSVEESYLIMTASVVLFLMSAAFLGDHCLVLAPVVLAILLGYSWTKRFTRYSHLVLGLALSLAPGGVWYALTAQFAWLPVWMMIGVLSWVTGFDIIYSCQDVDFDLKEGLHSIPSRVGVPNSLKIAKISHLISLAFLVIFGIAAGLGSLHYFGLLIFSLLLLDQHRIVSPYDLSRIDAAFFTRNGVASVIYLLFVAADALFPL